MQEASAPSHHRTSLTLKSPDHCLLHIKGHSFPHIAYSTDPFSQIQSDHERIRIAGVVVVGIAVVVDIAEVRRAVGRCHPPVVARTARLITDSVVYSTAVQQMNPLFPLSHEFLISS